MTSQEAFLTGHCPVTGRYFEPWRYSLTPVSVLLFTFIRNFSNLLLIFLYTKINEMFILLFTTACIEYVSSLEAKKSQFEKYKNRLKVVREDKEKKRMDFMGKRSALNLSYCYLKHIGIPLFILRYICSIS